MKYLLIAVLLTSCAGPRDDSFNYGHTIVRHMRDKR